MLSSVLCPVLAFVITFVSIPVIIRIAREKKLLDVPDIRKIHVKEIASLGGVGIFAGFSLACLISSSLDPFVNFQMIFAACIIIFFLGMKDDILIISPTKKLAGQIMAVAALLTQKNLLITDMQGFMGIHHLPLIAGYLVTFFAFIVIINAFNLIDGIDGLAGSLGLLVSVFLSVYFLMNGDSYRLLALALAGSLFAFLWFNGSPARIFMGDTGSMLTGIICGVLTLHFINTAPTSNWQPIERSLGVGFAMLVIPLLDAFRVFAVRLGKRRSPFTADKNHIHHLLLKRGLTHGRITLTLVIVNLFLLIVAFLLRDQNSFAVIILLTGIFYACVGGVKWAIGYRGYVENQPKGRKVKKVKMRNVVELNG